MNLALFYDTETTGLPDFKAPSEADHQPHLVQIAGVIADLDTKEIIERFETIVKPDGWVISEMISKIHGITHERAMQDGIPEKEAVDSIMRMWEKCGVRIGHNESFDAKLLRIALFRYYNREVADLWKAGNAECTADLSTSIVKIPPTARMLKAGFNKYKKPSLAEAYQHFMGKGFEDAHTALADTIACMEVYFAMKGLSDATN